MFNIRLPFVIVVYFRPFHATLNISVVRLPLRFALFTIRKLKVSAEERKRKINERAAFNELKMRRFKCEVKSFISFSFQKVVSRRVPVEILPVIQGQETLHHVVPRGHACQESLQLAYLPLEHPSHR